jgi:hypothetical protein
MLRTTVRVRLLRLKIRVTRWPSDRKDPQAAAVKIDQLIPVICAIVERALRSMRADYAALGAHFLKGLYRGYAKTQLFRLRW